jgi:hypothetical protein
MPRWQSGVKAVAGYRYIFGAEICTWPIFFALMQRITKRKASILAH